MLNCRRSMLIALCVLWTCVCTAEPAIWQVKGKHNTVYLIGTIHMLNGDEQLPTNIVHAYRDSKQLLMEIDMDDLDPLAAQTTTMELGMLPAGQSLSSQLDADTNKKLGVAAGKLGLDAGMLEQFRPWLAAVTLEQLQFVKLGYAADAGIEMQLTQLAEADHKPIQGLETLEQQLQLFAQLDANAQRAYLKQTLAELDQAPTELAALLTAWRNGDEAQMQRTLQQGMVDDPKLFTALTSARNRRWIALIKPLLEQQQDNYLVAVGALHLLGNEGLVALLQRAGYSVTRR
jgi:uncharacterized protein YbaP (TraB family)